jgi:hypothetical protein
MEKKPNEIVQCIVCQEDIRKMARKCIHCDSFQDWRRYLNFSNTVLALLVALLSVSTVLAPVLKEALEKDVSNVSVTYHGVHENLFNLIATNTGSKDGVISEEKLTLTNEIAESISFNLEPKFHQVVILGGTTIQSTTRLNPLDFERFIQWLDSNTIDNALLYVRAENYEAPAWEETFEVEMSDIRTIRAYAEKFPVPQPFPQ